MGRTLLFFGLFFSFGTFASLKPFIDWDPKTTWVTLEQDLVVKPGVTELYFNTGFEGDPREFIGLNPMAYCKVSLQKSSKNVRRIQAGAKTALKVKEIKEGFKENRIKSAILVLDGKTLESIECTNTTRGYPISSGMRAFEPGSEELIYHTGHRFSVRTHASDAQEVVDP